MIERHISIGSIDPLDFYGVNNSKFKVIKELFPKLQIVARGSELMVKGEKKTLDLFESKINLILLHYSRYNTLTDANLKRLILEDTKEIKDPSDPKNIILYGTNGKLIRSRNNNQRDLVEKVAKNDMTFIIGPAGTGKTYIAVALAVRALRNHEVKRIILSRPAVEAGENLGFLPGDFKEKVDPYLKPIYDALLDMIPARKLSKQIEEGVIQIAPLAYMRGRTLNDAFVILDEAQNTTNIQLKMFLTRMGTSSKFIITGDITQIDLLEKQQSGLVQAFHILNDIAGIAMLEFDNSDIVRHELVKKIVDAYEIDEENKEKKWKKEE